MTDAGPSGSNSSSRPRQSLFDLFEDGSDIDDDFEIPHVSDDSGSSSEEESVDGNTRSRSDENVRAESNDPRLRPDEFGWVEVDLEPRKPRIDPTFTVRNSLSAQNINLEETRHPLLFFFALFRWWTDGHNSSRNKSLRRPLPQTGEH
ncbi:hypothetical protein ElyMa_001417600 [Elysia marginata]|uniref:Uncharacterized protein n=1 Tax=Elysia marginata TaxID=1093978 RepID=A0AAV4IVP4_9GAST|nr:hypothetical protein ElyMa_001417600 [Elysia marginata]